jgi:LPXTG-motif cell wall-anchored protein
MNRKVRITLCIILLMMIPSSANAQEQSITNAAITFYYGSSESEPETSTDASAEASQNDGKKTVEKGSFPETGSKRSSALSSVGLGLLFIVFYIKKIWRNKKT